MKFTKTDIPDVVVIEPKVFADERGYFTESYRHDLFIKEIGDVNFIQDNESKSGYGTLRGLHYQLPPYSQSKLVKVVTGRVLDVAVDIREGSPSFGKYVSVELSEENKKQMFIPRGFAHGFVVLSESAVFQYKVDNYYNKESEGGIKWDDSSIGIEWLIKNEDVILSAKDAVLPDLKNSKLFEYGMNLSY